MINHIGVNKFSTKEHETTSPEVCLSDDVIKGLVSLLVYIDNFCNALKSYFLNYQAQVELKG